MARISLLASALLISALSNIADVAAAASVKPCSTASTGLSLKPSASSSVKSNASSSGRSTASASSSRRSSGRPSSGSLPATGSAPSSTCPAVTATLYTSTTTPVVTLTTTRSGPYELVYTSTAPTVTAVFTETEFTYFSTVTSIQTFTITEIELATASTTITIPTPADFTPVLCQADYFQSTVTSTAAATTQFADSFPTTTSTVTATYASTPLFLSYITTTSTFTATTTYPIETVTKTETRGGATNTVYDACKPNNIASTFPDGRAIPTAFPKLTAPVVVAYLNALDAVDCCGLCQGNSSCTLSSYYESSDNKLCQLFLLNSTDAQCSPRSRPGFFSDPSIQFNRSTAFSNGPCGQWQIPVWGFLTIQDNGDGIF